LTQALAARRVAILEILRPTALLLLAALFLSARAAASPDSLPSAASVVDPRVSSAVGADGVATVWVYLSDKGEPDAVGLERLIAAAAGRVTPASRARRLRGQPGPFQADESDVPVFPRYVRDIERAGARVRFVSRWLNAVSVDVDEAGLNAIAALSFVSWITPVGRIEAQLIEPTSYGVSLTQNQGIYSVAAHDSGYSGAGVVVAILDTGFRKDHLAVSQLKRIAEWDFVQSDGETANQTGEDPHQWDHGTGIWSILGGYFPGTLIGPAFNAAFVLAKTHDIGHSTKLDEDRWIAAAQWADSIGVDIVQSSMVINDPYIKLDGKTTATARATNILSRHGILVVTAMGNTGPNLGTLWTPSDCDSILAVGAVDQAGVITSFSSRGPTVDGRGKPDVVAQGQNTIWANAASTTSTGSVPGTSLAAPLVSGSAALVLEAHPEWTAQQVRYAIKSTASHAGSPDSNTYGWGIPNIVAAIYQSSLGPPIYPKPFWLKTPAKGSSVAASSVTFRWGRAVDFTPGDAVTYSLVVKTVSPSAVVYTTTTADTFATMPGSLASGTAYEYNVTATDLASHARPATEPYAFTTTGSPNNPPVVTAPPTVAASEGTLASFSVSAADPDGPAIATLVAAPLPAGASFTANGDNTSGTFQWTPGFAQAGSYSVTFTASNALTGVATTQITVANVDRAPVVTVPAAVASAEGALTSFTVSATDPDGSPIASLTAAPLPTGAAFTPNGDNTSGTFEWTPGFDQAGAYDVTFTASNAISGQAATQITVANVDRAPVVTAPATVAAQESSLVSFVVSAADPDDSPIASLTAAPLPAGASFTPNGDNTSGTLQWTPGFDQAGSYSVTFTASNTLSGQATTQITVADADRPPVVTAPPDVSGIAGSTVAMSVTASDPDGDAIDSLSVDTHSLPMGNDATFSTDSLHTTGSFTWNPALADTGTYIVAVKASNALATQAFVSIRVVPPMSIQAPSDTTGTAGVPLTLEATAVDPDTRKILTITVSGAPASLSFSHTPTTSPATGTLSGTLTLEDAAASPFTIVWHVDDGSGGTATATTVLQVTTVTAAPVPDPSSGAPRVLSFRNRPNPFQSATQIDVGVAGHPPNGSWRVRIYDLSGRLVRTLLDGAPWRSTTVAWDGTTNGGARAASGVYYYRLESSHLQATRRLILLK